MIQCAACRTKFDPRHSNFVTYANNRSICIKCHDKGRTMIDVTEHEKQCLQHASAVGGEYIESINKEGLFTSFTAEEWATLVEVIVGEYLEQSHKAPF